MWLSGAVICSQLNTDVIKFDEYFFVKGKKSSIFYLYELMTQNKSAALFLLWTFTFHIFIFVHFNVMVWVFCSSFTLYIVDFIVMCYFSLPVFVCIWALVLLTTVSLSHCMFLIFFHGYGFFSIIILLFLFLDFPCCLFAACTFDFLTSTCLPVNLASLFDTHNNQEFSFKCSI